MTPYYPKLLLIIFATISLNFCIAQSKKGALPKSSIFAGKYSYGKDIEKGRVGFVTVYPETDSTILFYLDVNRGAPSYNMGALYGRIKLQGSKGMYSSMLDSLEMGCEFTVEFKSDSLIIKTSEKKDDCGLGYGVYADGRFKRKSSSTPEYFIDATGDKVYFKKRKPD